MGNLPTKWASDRAFDLADKYLTRYFKGFDTSKVRLGCAGGGAIELGPLQMRPEAFRHSDNAVEIKAGYIGKLHIRLPNLHELATGPFTVRVQGAAAPNAKLRRLNPMLHGACGAPYRMLPTQVLPLVAALVLPMRGAASSATSRAASSA